MHIEDLRIQVSGQVIAEGEAGFTAACEGLVWNGRKPQAAPRVIVKAASTADVQAAVRYAGANGLGASARSSGHNWSGIALQHGVAIDLGALDGITVDRTARRAEVGPAARNLDLAVALTEQGLAFPVGHCGQVALGGYLLGGGFGWNESTWGPACHLVEKAEVVLADGRAVIVSASDYSDIFWALRGAGPLFFGIVTRFWLRLLPLPPAMILATWTYPLDRISEVTAAAKRLAERLPSFAELSVSMAAAPPAAGLGDAKFATVILTVFGGSMPEVLGLASTVGSVVPEGAVMQTPPMPFDFATLYGMVDQAYPSGSRYGVDFLWSGQAEATFAGLAQMIAAAPSARSNAMGVIYSAKAVMPQGQPDAALSKMDRVIGIVHGTWGDPSEDDANLSWLRAGMDGLDPVTTGRYVGHADLARPGRLEDCFSKTARARLAELSALHDPKGVFAGRQVQERPGSKALGKAILAAE